MMVALYGRANVQTRRTVPSCNSTPFKESLSPGIIEWGGMRMGLTLRASRCAAMSHPATPQALT